MAIGAVGGLAMGVFLAVWVLCLGYVYADAKRRAMRPVLWTLIAALFPHLFGFLLYFALRQPMTPRCMKCGQPVTLDQRFCSWCGSAGAGERRGNAGPGRRLRDGGRRRRRRRAVRVLAVIEKKSAAM